MYHIFLEQFFFAISITLYLTLTLAYCLDFWNFFFFHYLCEFTILRTHDGVQLIHVEYSELIQEQ